jgi:hypothetical protein
MKQLIAASLVWCHLGSASAAVPGWCKDAAFDDRYDLKDLSSQDVETVIETFAKATCKPSAEAQASAAQIDAARQAWGKKLGMSDADWADAVAFANTNRPGGLELSTKDLAAMTALDQYRAIREGMPSTGQGTGFDDADYLADMFEPNLTEVGRLGFIERCIDYPAASYIPAVVFAQCQADIDGLDQAKFAAQLRADTAHPGENKMAIRFKLHGLPARLKAHADKVKKLWASDAAYKKLWEAATRGRAAFAATIGADPALLALATRLDSAQFFQSRKLFDGCERPTEAALFAVITAKVSASMFKDAGRDMPKAKGSRDDASSVASRVGPALIDIPELAFVTGPYAECHKKDATAAFLASLLYYVPGYRGPRRAALTAITREKIALDDLSATIDYPKVGQPFIDQLHLTGSAGGVVKSVKVEGDLLLVALDKLLVKREECVQSHRTNRVSRINSDGSLSYELICDKLGVVTYDDTPADFRIDKKFQAVLKTGVQFSAVGTAIFALWPNRNAKLPTMVLGAPVK